MNISPLLRERLERMAATQPAIDAGAALDRKWQALVASEPQKLYSGRGRLNFENLAKFRRLEIFVSDQGPYTDFANLDPRHWIGRLAADPLRGFIDFAKERLVGTYRGNRRALLEAFHRLERENALDYLRRYPLDRTPGDPYVFRHRGYSFNFRWLRHIYFLSIIDRHIGGDIRNRPSFVNLDIGCSFSVFASLLKREFPLSRHILVDFPDQLLLSAYYLGQQFPEARFATMPEIGGVGRIDRAYVDEFDFVLVPVQLFERIAGGAADMITNFFSFGEMPRKWFDKYIASDVRRQADYFFTCNRFESAPRHEPTYDTDLTVLDYPFADYERMFFGIFPIYPFYTKRRGLFFYEQLPFSSQYFDFLGRRRKPARDMLGGQAISQDAPVA